MKPLCARNVEGEYKTRTFVVQNYTFFIFLDSFGLLRETFLLLNRGLRGFFYAKSLPHAM